MLREWQRERERESMLKRVAETETERERERIWQAELVVDFLPHLLNAADVTNFLTTAGEQVGIGDWRPRYGRFFAEPVAATEPDA